MPRDGSGASDNAIEAGETKVHGAGSGANDVSAYVYYLWTILQFMGAEEAFANLTSMHSHLQARA